MKLSRAAAFVLAIGLAFFPVLGTVAQDDTPRADPNAPTGDRTPTASEALDLAAVALDASDVGADYTLSFESYIPVDLISSGLLDGAVSTTKVEATGIVGYYESVYETADKGSTITCYVEEYGSAAEVQKGFNLFENEELTGKAGATATDGPGLGIGDEPSEVTTGKTKASGDTPATTSLDATFRVDRLLVGVAVADASATAPDEKLLTDLATRLQERAQAVVDGDDLPDIDTTLPGTLLGFGDSLTVNEGYGTFADAFGTGAPAGVDSTFTSAYGRTVALGQDPTADIPLPIVTLQVSSFSSESAMLALLSNATTVTPAFEGVKLEQLDLIPGTSAAVALSFADPFSGGKEPNSFRLLVVIGDRLLAIDVYGAKTAGAAKGAALSLATQEVGCFAAGATCGTAELPAGFGDAKG